MEQNVLNHIVVKMDRVQTVLPVIYDCREEEVLLNSQIDASEQFSHTVLDGKSIQGYLYMFLKSRGKCDVPLQIFQSWDFITPLYIFIPRISYYEVIMVCKYNDDSEESCELYFEEGKLKTIKPGTLKSYR